jgi:hypothetical protein
MATDTATSEARPLTGEGVRGLFGTHPAAEVRILCLLALLP